MKDMKTIKNFIMVNKKIICTVLTYIFVVLSLVFLWNLKFRDLSIPIEHRTSIVDGSFNTTVGLVREIAISDVQLERRCTETISDLSIEVYSKENDLIWATEIPEIELSNDFNLIAHYEREDALVWESGEYYVKCFTEGEENPYIRVRFTEFNGSPKKYYVALSVMILLVVTVCVLFVGYIKLAPEKEYFILAVVLGLFSLMLFTPLSAGDEIYHFAESYKLSSIVTGSPVYDDYKHLILRADDYNSIEYLHDMSGIAGWYDSWDKGDVATKVVLWDYFRISSKAKYVYVIPTVGIVISRLLSLSGHTLIMSGAICNLLLMAFIIAMAIRIMPYGKWYFATVGLVPELMYLGSSYSYDGLNMSLCMLIVALFANLSFTKEEIKYKDILLFLIPIVLLTPIKLIYGIFALLLFLLPPKKIKVPKWIVFITIGVIAVVGVVGIIAYLPVVKSLLGAGGVYANNENGVFNIRYVLDNKFDTLRVCLNTLFYDGDKLFAASLGEILGRDRIDGRDIYTIPVVLQLIIITIAIIGLQDTRENKTNGIRRAIISLMIVCIIVMVAMAMLFSDTLLSEWKISGIQGRYFLPVYPLLAIAFKNSRISIKADKRKVCILGMAFVNVCFCILAIYHYAFGYFANY